MPIITAGICNKAGDLIVSRQFIQMIQTSVLDLYCSFPKLITKNQQHTFVQDGKYRILYLASNQLYLVIATSLDFNIIQAQQTLKLLYRVVISVCVQGVNQKNVVKSSWDILLALDDIIAFGQRQSMSVEDVVDAVKIKSTFQEDQLQLLQKKSDQVRDARDVFSKDTKSK